MPRGVPGGAASGVALAAVMTLFVRMGRADIARVQADFTQYTRGMATAVQGSLIANLEVIEDIERLFASSRSVERREFRTFVQRALSANRGVQALE